MAQEPEQPDRTRHARLQELFLAALDLDDAERDAFLDRECGEDAELRAAVLAMLGSAQRSEGFLEGLDTRDATPFIEAVQEASAVGRTVGPYTLERELGRGGMGVVYLARRTDGHFEQEVALKLIKLGMDSESILRRFLRERQILAWLRHDGIAQLLDGGLTEDGRPYFALEYVPGQPISEYCDAQGLPVEDRLRLFLAAGAAVQFAHANLVVHRDLKPSNILVSSTGQVKLLDFGIAKLLDEEGDLRTLTGQQAMTPECASPEQLRGRPVTTATDVYALGLILYELLTGRRPYQFGDSSVSEMAEIIAKTPPTRPSAAVQRADTISRRDGSTREITPEAVSRARGTRPDRLRRRLAGDLDTIVLTALQEDPARRYASVEAFMEDLERYLDGLPVRARSDTAPYRLGKFVRRNALAVAAATVVALLLAGTAVISTLQRAQTERERAKLERVNDFVLGLFEAANPSVEAQGNSITARELLDRGVQQVDDDLAEEPEIKAQMLAVIGTAYRGLGLYDAAESPLREALALRQEELGPDHTQVAESLNDLGNLIALQGDIEEGARLRREALDIWERAHRGDHPAIAHGMESVAISLREQQQFDAADSLGRAALAMHQRLYGERSEEAAAGMAILANALLEGGETEEAERLYREALQIRQEIHGGDHTTIASLQSNLGMLLSRAGQLDEAEDFLQEALAMKRRLFDEDSARLVAPMTNLADVLGRKANLEEAESLQREALALNRLHFGDEHPEVAISLNNLAANLQRMGRLDEAEPLFLESLAINREALGDHPRVAIGLHNLASFHRLRGNYERAIETHEESLAMLREIYGDENPWVGAGQTGMALAYFLKGDFETSEPMFRDALTLLQAGLPEGHFLIADAVHGLGEVILARGRPEEAEPLLREALEICRRAYPEGHPGRTRSAGVLGACLSQLGRYEEAEPLLLLGYEGVRDHNEGSTRRKVTLEALIAHFERRGQPEMAEPYREQLR